MTLQGGTRVRSMKSGKNAPEVGVQILASRRPFFLNLSKTTKFRIKLLFSLTMFASLFIFGKVDLSKSLDVALKANLWFITAAALMFLLTTFVNGKRWQLLAHAVGLDKSLMQLVQYCFVGLFFNFFLPSTVGGDFSRGYYLSKGTGKYKRAFYSVLADRVVGIAVLFLFATAGIALGPGGGDLPWQLRAPIFLGTLAILVLVPAFPALCRLIFKESPLIERFLNSKAQVYWTDKRLIGEALLLSVGMQIIMVGCHIAIGLSLGLSNVPLWYYFVFYPSVAVLGFITPSFNGIGIREWAYTYFLTLAGVDRSHALTYAIIWLGLISFSSLVGGIVYIAGHFQIPREEPELSELSEPE